MVFASRDYCKVWRRPFAPWICKPNLKLWVPHVEGFSLGNSQIMPSLCHPLLVWDLTACPFVGASARAPGLAKSTQQYLRKD